MTTVLHHITQSPPWALALGAAAVFVTGAVLVYLTVHQAAAALWRARARARAGRRQVERETGRAVRSTLADAGPLAVLGACGMAVSLYGLWGFARDTAELPLPLRIAFCAIFDVAELVCFVSLYRAALESKVWTPSMRRTRRMAWTLVAASAAMNAAHAPGGRISMVVLAAVPVVSARLVEHGLDQKLEANAGDEEAEAKPGPVRLVQLGWLHGWARIFAAFGLDAGSVDGQVPAEARIRRAAGLVYELGQALDRCDELAQDPKTKRRERGQAVERVEQLRARAQAAIDSAGVATDTAAALTMARYLVARGRVGDLARMDVTNPMGVLTLLEDLAITPSADAIKAGARAAVAEKAAQAAEDARREAEDARQEAERAAEEARARAAAEAKAAEERTAAAETARTEAEAARARAVAETEAAEERAATAARAAQAAEDARREAEDARQEAERAARTLREDAGASTEALDAAERAVREAETARQQAADEARRRVEEARAASLAQRGAEDARRRAEQRAEEAAGQLRQLQDAAAAVEAAHRRQAVELDQLTAARQTAEQETAEAAARAQDERAAARQAAEDRRAAETALTAAQAQILALMTGEVEPHTGDEWKSPEKAAGWELYRRTVRESGSEPSATELHQATGEAVHIGTVRSWIGDFRQRLAGEAVEASQPLRAARADAESDAPASSPSSAPSAAIPALLRRLTAADPRTPHTAAETMGTAPQVRRDEGVRVPA
ncbi:hypothetical protein [Actinacidiphila sp. bgisy144]|uniref:hypothetical protein n=1 Tax=Actinacidiphila sp. bgisy144 TaxID=3413791 RepID=UPI003EB8055D